MSVIAMLTLTILRELHAKSADFVMAYTQDGAKTEILMKVPIGFELEGGHPREWVVRLDKTSMA